jgi:hypothetical protein
MQEPTELLHAYRSLLRAATYLPDSFARTQIHNSIVFRFKSTSRKFKSKKPPIHKDHTQERLAEARKNARWLERAGNGNVSDLKKVLLVAYGRTGKRRRELIKSLVGPQENDLPQDDAALEKLIQNPGRQSEIRFSPNSKFYSFLRSQASNQPSNSDRRPIRELNVHIPKENIWGRATPIKAQAGMRRKWWARTLHKLIPPIPQHEWNHLRDLATGRIPIEEIPQRRARGSSSGEDRELSALHYLRNPQKAEVMGFEEIMFNVNEGLQPKAKGANALDRSFPLNRRTMRRLYASIWNQTPTMVQDETTKLWETKWGEERSAAQSGAVTQSSMSDRELFEGIDDLPSIAGKPLSRHTKRKLKNRV